MNGQNKWLPDYIAGSPTPSRRSHRDAEASHEADSVTVRPAGLAVSIRSKQPLILIFSPSEGEKRTQIRHRLESLRACLENGFQEAQATRLFRPATRRTERKQRFEVMRTA